MAQDNSRYWSPNRTYEFELKIGKIDLTPDLYSLTILTSVDLPYQTFLLQIFLDPKDIILDEIYGQKPLKLKSRMYGTAPSLVMEEINFELMYLSSDMPIEITPVNSRTPANMQKDRSTVTFTCVARYAYMTMSTLINSVHQGKKLSDVIADMIDSVGATLNYDSKGENSEVIDQVLIPPSTLYKNLRYINKTFGIYNGMAAIYCSHDNIVNIKNLTKKMQKSDQFIIYQLPTDTDNTEIIESCNDGKRFYTTENMHTKYKGNSAFAYLAPRMRYIVKPKDRLFSSIDIELESFAQEYGLISKDNNIFYDNKALPSATRVSLHKDHTGYELTKSFINAKLSRNICAITELSVTVQQSMKILNLMNVGEAVKIDTKIEATRDFTGLYILRASQINFVKETDWQSSANLFLMRTNRSIT